MLMMSDSFSRDIVKIETGVLFWWCGGEVGWCGNPTCRHRCHGFSWGRRVDEAAGLESAQKPQSDYYGVVSAQHRVDVLLLLLLNKFRWLYCPLVRQ